MSVRSEKVRQALFGKLNVAAVVGAGKATGVYHRKAPETANLPYVIFHRQAPRPVTRAFQQNVIAEDDWWLIKALTDEDSSASKEPEELAEDILEACEAAIGTSLTLTGSETWTVERISDMPEYTEPLNDRDIYHYGFFLRVVTH